MKIYLDACCFNRPFDRELHERIYWEAEAVLAILARCQRGEWQIAASPALEFEFAKITDRDKWKKVRGLYSAATLNLPITPEVAYRARAFRQLGLAPFDSIHLALAEVHGIDVFLTTDDQLLRLAQTANLRVTAGNPTRWLMEVMK